MLFIERHMNLCLIAGCALGLIWPYWQGLPDESVLALIMGATFIACFRIRLHDIKHAPWRLISWFYTLRYLLFPLAIYFISGIIFPKDIALGMMLIATLPVGASAPAMSHVFGGQVSLTAIFTLLTTLLAPFVMPTLFMLVNTGNAHPPMDMFITLIVTLIIPCVLFLFLGRIRKLHHVAEHYGKGLTILMISFMIAIVVGKQRDKILDAPMLMLGYTAITLVLLSLLLIIGWRAGCALPREQRIALTTASGFNNIGLGVGMSLLHFSGGVVLIALATEIAWALLPIPMKKLIKGGVSREPSP